MSKAEYKIFAGAWRRDWRAGAHCDVAALSAAVDAAGLGVRAGWLGRHALPLARLRVEWRACGHPRPLAALAAREHHLALVRSRVADPAAPPPVESVSAVRLARLVAVSARAAAVRS